MKILESRWTTVALLAVSLALFWLLFRTVDVGKVATAVSNANLPLLVAALALTFAGLSLRTARWGVIVREKQPVSWRDLYVIQCSGMAVSHFSPGKVLEAAKVLPLKALGVTYSYSILSIFWERVMDIAVLFAFALLAFPLLDPNIRYALVAVMAIVALTAIASFRHLDKLVRLASKLPVIGKSAAKLEVHNFKKRTLAAAFLLTLLAWMLDAAGAWLAFKAMGMQMDFIFLTTAFLGSILAGIVTFLPGGLGSTEAIMLFLLTPSGYAAEMLLGGVLVARAFTLGLSAIVGFGLLPFVPRKKS